MCECSYSVRASRETWPLAMGKVGRSGLEGLAQKLRDGEPALRGRALELRCGFIGNFDQQRSHPSSVTAQVEPFCPAPRPTDALNSKPFITSSTSIAAWPMRLFQSMKA